MFPLQPKEFWIYYAAATALALLFFLRRGRRRGMRLRLRVGNPPPRQASGRTSTPPTAQGTSAGAASGEVASATSARPVERPLNVVFNYNGHSWDAYEVLGLPAGSSLAHVRAAFAEASARVDEGSRPFLQAALSAIEEQLKSIA
ncbi:MAG: hypothetical protein AB7G93_08550 [Bdellovibrionales bacterium]